MYFDYSNLKEIIICKLITHLKRVLISSLSNYYFLITMNIDYIYFVKNTIYIVTFEKECLEKLIKFKKKTV